MTAFLELAIRATGALGATLPVYAQEFVPLIADLPLVPDSGDLVGLLNGLYQLTIIGAVILAVIMVTIGGFKYMLTDSVSSMGGAKEQITDALIGLGIVPAAVLLLNIINPSVTNIDILPGVTPTGPGGVDLTPNADGSQTYDRQHTCSNIPRSGPCPCPASDSSVQAGATLVSQVRGTETPIPPGTNVNITMTCKYKITP